MSKGGRGAAANVLMLKKAENRRQEVALREAFKVIVSTKTQLPPQQNLTYSILISLRGLDSPYILYMT